ncbi:AMP-binding protein [Streptomyces sp. NPDC006283]|uniref:AMP-binding protein n=1 Tax=Streptomyces sp. NPDC006283 TaxID=3156741 RepID=UPI0033B28D40
MLTTSGATLAPTIVPLRHAAVDRFTAWAAGAFGIGPGTTVLSHAPLDSGPCLLDIWTTLAAGGCAVLADPDLATDGRHLLDLVTRHGVHVVHGRPALHGLLADAARRTGTTLPSVRHAMFTGATLPDRTFAELPHLFPNARLHNIYGCTETGDSFAHEVDTRTTAFPPVPIGRPLPGVAALVVGANGTPVDGPGRGELYVCTPFQSPGYLDRSRHRGTFTPHPLHADDGRTWFRTGDLVRRDADGLLHLTGRAERPAGARGTRRITRAALPARATRHVERAALDRRNELIPAQGRTS